MKCPFCGHVDSRVLESRTSEEGSSIRRRRECPDCGRRFRTYERAEEIQVFVIKKDGRREPLDREKLLAGMTKACEKRPIPREQIEAAAEEVEHRLRDELTDEIASRRVGELVMEKLREMDEVAYVRFASVYKEFRDTDSFVREIQGLARERADQSEPAETTLLPGGSPPEDS
jgi:transcriptional repressor NrdR